MPFLDWWQVVFAAIFAYFYFAFSVGKYYYWKEYGLKSKPVNEDYSDIAWSSILWPLAVMMEPHKHARGLYLPTMYLDREFRERYPVIKRQAELDRQRETEVLMNQHVRDRNEARAAATLRDKEHDWKHHRRMALIERETDEINQKLMEDIPPQLEPGEKYQPEPEVVIETAAFYCSYHGTWHDADERYHNPAKCHQ